MLWLLIATLSFDVRPTNAAHVKVRFPDDEHLCEATLDTKKMPKAKFDRIADLIRFWSRPRDPLGFVNSVDMRAAAKAEMRENLAFVGKAVKELDLFRQPRWKKLGKYYLQRARAEQERQAAAIAFMESWNPAPLLDGPADDELAQRPRITPEPDMTKEREEQLFREAKERIRKLPPEERELHYLTCDQRLRLLADESKLEKFSVNVAYAQFARGGDRNRYKKDFIIAKEMAKTEREGRRMYLFQWAWYNNDACTQPRTKFALPKKYAGPRLEEELLRVVSGLKCEENCP